MSDLKKTVDALNNSGFIAKEFETMAEAKQEILALIQKEDSVSTGGSMTLEDSGILNSLQDKGCEMLTAWVNPDFTSAEKLTIRKKGLFADWFLTSTNAVTLGGDLVNIDGSGNRVATMIFGPPKTIVLAGKNKITKNPMDAVARIKRQACGKNARRLKLNLPCALDDRCHNCNLPDSMCKVTIRMEHPPSSKEAVYVFLVNEDWGY